MSDFEKIVNRARITTEDRALLIDEYIEVGKVVIAQLEALKIAKGAIHDLKAKIATMQNDGELLAICLITLIEYDEAQGLDRKAERLAVKTWRKTFERKP